MAHPHETAGQHMEQEATDKLVDFELHGFTTVPILSVPIAEDDLAIVDRQDTIIG